PYVDLIQSLRSSGSILKPILYGKAIDRGLIHSSSFLRDVPINIDQFSPKNFDGEFEGVVPADKALAKSLNVPATLLLKDYGVPSFLSDLKGLGFRNLSSSANTYGLTLILGGAEVRLVDLAEFYAFQAQLLNDPDHDFSLSFWGEKNLVENRADYMSNGAWWLVTGALQEVERPGINMDWRSYSNSRKIAWKTGTSHGFRDAWAIGYDADHLVAVWVGNADGEGRPGLTGVSAAGPLLFNIFQFLPQNDWFEKPEYDLKNQVLCSASGYPARAHCPKQEKEVPLTAEMQGYCEFHEKILMNSKGEQVFRGCTHGKVLDTTVLMLDPIASYYYRTKNKGSYTPIVLSEDCSKQVQNSLGIVYPARNARLIIPKNFSGELEKVLFKAFHSDRSKTIYWHIDGQYVGATQGDHELIIELSKGQHKLLIIDELGNEDDLNFKVYIDK
ncbi:MAG: penicillin-binding transpeptidase domain-containing protein, partial [Bacteroidota bacterium]